MIPFSAHVARRTFLQNSGVSLGSMALTSLLAEQNHAAQDAQNSHWNGVVSPPHFEPRAKRIIWLYMAGGMTHIDTFDNKPKLAELNGMEMPESVTKGQQIAQLQGQKLNCFALNMLLNNGVNRDSQLQKSGRCWEKNVPMRSALFDRCTRMQSITIQLTHS